jgi:hypothetical protein
MTKIEKIQGLLEDVEADIRKATIADIIADLKDYLRDGTDVDETEKRGLKVAIEFIELNY